MSTATSTEAELLPGYYIEAATGAWLTLPWPADLKDLPPSLGPQIIRWGELWLVNHISGEPWRYTVGQKKFLHLWYALRPDGKWLYRSGVKRGAKGPLAHDTPVMTPDGWVLHGDLRPGMQVFGGDGLPCTVVAVHPEVLEDCWRITFSDGESIVATGQHRWPLQSLKHFYADRVATTEEIDGTVAVRRDGARNWRQQMPPPVKLPEADLPMDPYLLGYWLGDGDKNSTDIATLDLGVLDSYTAADFRVTHKKNGRNHRVGGLLVPLRAAGVLGNKHVPAVYLRGSIDQRLSLVQGLMDSDGYCDERGRMEFCNTNRALVDAFAELLASLGVKFGCAESRAKLNGVDYGPRWRIAFTCFRDDLPMFRIPRKLDRQRFAKPKWDGMCRTRRVVLVERVPTVAARCITVDSADHTYRVGRKGVVTFNTGKDPLAAAMANTELCGPVRFAGWDQDGAPIGVAHRLALVQIAANSEAQAMDVLRVANAMHSLAMREEFDVDAGVLRTQLPSGSRLELLTNSERSSEGDPATAIFLNESHHMTDSSGGQALAGVARRNTGKSPGGIARVLELTNAHLPGENAVAEGSFLAWQQQVAGKTRRADILYDSREAPPHLQLHIEEELEEGIAAAYADSPWTDQERIRDEAQDPRVSLGDSIRFYFNALPTNEFSWIDPRKFDALARPELFVTDGEAVALFLDCSKSTDATAFCGCRLSDGFVFGLGIWQRPHGDRGKGWLAPREQVDAAVMEAKERFDVQWFGVDPSPAKDDETEAQYWAPVVDKWHREFRETVLIWATPGSTVGSSVAFDMRLSVHGGHERNRLFTEAAEQTAQDIDHDDALIWDGDPMLRVHVHNARRRPNQWGVSLSKQTRDSSHLVDYAVTMVGARMGRRIVLNSGKTRGKKRSGKASFL